MNLNQHSVNLDQIEEMFLAKPSSSKELEEQNKNKKRDSRIIASKPWRTRKSHDQRAREVKRERSNNNA